MKNDMKKRKYPQETETLNQWLQEGRNEWNAWHEWHEWHEINEMKLKQMKYMKWSEIR